MQIFEGQNLLEFIEHFQTNEDCKKYLSHFKWYKGYACIKCGHMGYQIRKDYSRTCNKCSHTESSTANTLFHKVKFGIRKAFFICYEMATSTKSLSANYVEKRYGITEKTARLFMHKVREAMKSSEQYLMNHQVQVDEFVVGGKEENKPGRSYDSNKHKAVCALELTEDKKVKRMYAMKIDNFSAKELRQIFDKHIDKRAEIATDGWKAYRPISKDYKIEQIPSEKGNNFAILHTMIHQIKSWIRTTYSHVNSFHLNRYFNEFCYRLNRSQNKRNVFNNLIRRMVTSEKVYQADLICT